MTNPYSFDIEVLFAVGLNVELELMFSLLSDFLEM